jgi:hypothetical protein
MGARYLLMIGAHFAELSEINHPADRELNGNDLDRIPYKDHQINVTTQPNPSSEFEADCCDDGGGGFQQPIRRR